MTVPILDAIERKAMDADLSLQLRGSDERKDELVWFPLLLRGDEARVQMRISREERGMFVKMLTGVVRARHHPD